MNEHNQRLKQARQARSAQLRKLRDEEKLTQKQLAIRVGVTRQRVQQLLNGA